MKRIQSRLHRIGPYNVCKISLSYFDDKRHKRLIISCFYFDKIGKDFMELIKTS